MRHTSLQFYNNSTTTAALTSLLITQLAKFLYHQETRLAVDGEVKSGRPYQDVPIVQAIHKLEKAAYKGSEVSGRWKLLHRGHVLVFRLRCVHGGKQMG